MNSHKKESYDFLDLTKFILSAFVVAIHSSLFTEYLYPWLRIAVPLFFMISSYLFFKKVNTYEHSLDQNRILKRFAIKQLKLFAVWSVILFPIVLYVNRNRFYEGVIGILRLIKSFLFGGTFAGGWFIIALIEAVAIVFFLSRKIKPIGIFIIGLLLNGVSIFKSSYLCLFGETSKISRFFDLFELFFANPVLTFFTAIIWVLMGKVFAEHKFKLNLKIHVLIAIISSALLYLEWRLLFNYTNNNTNDCYVALIPLCISLFAIIEHFKRVKIPHAKFLRKASTIMYVVHGAFVSVSVFVLDRMFGNVHRIIIFSLTVIFCVILTVIISCLEKYNKFKWLKVLY